MLGTYASSSLPLNELKPDDFPLVQLLLVK
jgi:hypothetical protein